MCDDDVAALVVDNGSGMCKAGFAGDDAPRYCIYTHIPYPFPLEKERFMPHKIYNMCRYDA